MENLAYEEGFGEIRKELSEELEAELRRTLDPRAEGKGDIFDTYRYVGNAPHAWYRLESKYKEWLKEERERRYGKT